jgi:hypothetical protein
MSDLVPPYFYVTGTFKMIVQSEDAEGAIRVAADGLSIAAGFESIKMLSADQVHMSAEEIED